MRGYFLLLLFFLLPFLFLTGGTSSTAAAPPTPPSAAPEDDVEAIEEAVLVAVEKQREFVLSFLVYDVEIVEVLVSKDGTRGIAYLELVDPDTGQSLPVELGLAIAVKTNTIWDVTLPADPGWLQLLESTPEEILPAERKAVYIEMNAVEAAAIETVYGGYLLPWEAGKTVYVSQTVGHDQYIPSGSAHYAFDFYLPQTMYRLYASKAGTVWRARWDVPNGDASDMGNYLVLMDTSTNPVTYQLYLHLAQDSIPEALRTIGTYVAQGQYIGMADDTGQSTGHHLHFHVHTNPASYWGTSVDITFNDVAINGGRPRVLSDKPYCTRPTDVCEQFQTAYVSGNVIHGDTIPPGGGLFEPVTGTVVNNKTVHVEGWASDIGSGLAGARLIAYFGNAWHDVGSEFTALTFALDWDMCASDVPDGPVSLAIKAWDKEGNLSQGYPGLTHVIKNFDCSPPPPACTPGANQVALFSETDFRGECQNLGAGEYSNAAGFGIVGDDNIESVLLGSNVFATLYSGADFSGRSSTLASADSSLEDNPIGVNTVSSLKVQVRADPPSPPGILVSPQDDATFSGNSSLSFSWRDPGGATQFQVRVTGPPGQIDSPWTGDPFWHLETHLLTPGTYTWKVRARNCAQAVCQSAWSQSDSFTIIDPPAALAPTTAPFSDGIESGLGNWRSSGLWNRLSDAERAHTGSYSWYYGIPSTGDYSDGTPNMGDLTLRPVTIPGSGYVLRFWFLYDTEGPEKNWDQRWVQISTDGGPFVNVLQLHDDVEDYWLRTSLDLSAYAGKTIQVRFHFATLDGQSNSGNAGWYIDDVEIAQITLPECSDSDNTPAKARTLEYGVKKSGRMCPPGDVDYYKFEGTAGDRIVLNVDTPAEVPVDNLDLILFLLDNDGNSVLEAHDDEIYAEKLDPHLGYRLVRSGTYYVKARLWAHPSYGDLNFTYSITLSKDNQKPAGDFANPLTGMYLPDTDQLLLTVNAADNKSGVSRVEFLYHSGDWAASSWQALGTDLDGADGWTQTFDTSALAEQKDIAFFANIYDWAGNWSGGGAWNLGIDRTPPVSMLLPVAANQGSTAVKLQWTASDNLSGLSQFDLQSQIGFGTWLDEDPDPAGTATHSWYIGHPGIEYGFRIRGVDYAGNTEAFPPASETRAAIPSPSTLCSAPDSWDATGNDNSPDNASLVIVGAPGKTHNFCNPIDANRLYDEDWVRINVEAEETYIFELIPGAETTAGILELYAANGNTLITAVQSDEFGDPAILKWTADRTGRIYLRMRHTDGRVAGNAVSYSLIASRMTATFLPIVTH